MGFLNAPKPPTPRQPPAAGALGPPKHQPELNRLLFALAESRGGDAAIKARIEALLPAVRLLGKIHGDPLPVPNGTTVVTGADSRMRFATHTLGAEVFVVFFINPDDPRLAPRIYEMTLTEALRVIGSRPAMAGLLLWNNDKSFIGYKKDQFPYLRKLLGLEAPAAVTGAAAEPAS